MLLHKTPRRWQDSPALLYWYDTWKRCCWRYILSCGMDRVEDLWAQTFTFKSLCDFHNCNNWKHILISSTLSVAFNKSVKMKFSILHKNQISLNFPFVWMGLKSTSFQAFCKSKFSFGKSKPIPCEFTKVFIKSNPYF